MAVQHGSATCSLKSWPNLHNSPTRERGIPSNVEESLACVSGQQSLNGPTPKKNSGQFVPDSPRESAVRTCTAHWLLERLLFVDGQFEVDIGIFPGGRMANDL